MRQLAASKILSILNDIQGTAEQFDTNSQLTEQGFILKNDGEIPVINEADYK